MCYVFFLFFVLFFPVGWEGGEENKLLYCYLNLFCFCVNLFTNLLSSCVCVFFSGGGSKDVTSCFVFSFNLI